MKQNDKFVLVRQDNLMDVQEIFIYDSEDEAVEKMETECANTIWYYEREGMYVSFFEEGPGYKSLCFKYGINDDSDEEPISFFWTIHISD